MSARDLRGGETIDIDLREQRIEGTVADASTQQPIAGATVTLVAANDDQPVVNGEVQTNANGFFRLSTGGAGAHRLVASANGFANGSLQVYQSLLVKPDGGSSGLPLTREDWYGERVVPAHRAGGRDR